MAHIECRSSQAGVPSQWVDIEHITDAQVVQVRTKLDCLLNESSQVSSAVMLAFMYATTLCPTANPSDLWQHVIYRHLLDSGWSDQRWKRVAGFALERAFMGLYQPRLEAYGLRMRILPSSEANSLLDNLNITEIRAPKIDLFLEGKRDKDWRVFGAVHVKSSIAERIQDDVPASRAFINRGFLSIVLTMDMKSYPPPHGDCINYGELGGRSLGIKKERIKRNYIEVAGQFDGLFSFNLRTPPSPLKTDSGKRIYTMSLHDEQPDQLVCFLKKRWESIHANNTSD